MPCQYYTDDEKLSMAYGALTKLTRVSCDMRTILRRHGLECELCEVTREWIRKHDREDAERVKREEENGVREATRKRGLAKLDLDERRALGL